MLRIPVEPSALHMLLTNTVRVQKTEPETASENHQVDSKNPTPPQEKRNGSVADMTQRTGGCVLYAGALDLIPIAVPLPHV